MPSIGSPMALTMRPSQAAVGRTLAPSRRMRISAPGATPNTGPNGISRARVSPKPTPTARSRGRPPAAARAASAGERAAAEGELDQLTARLVEAGLAGWAGLGGERQLIVRGQANLLDDLTALDDLERIRLLFADLETKTDVIDLLNRAETGEGVRIFIGAENKLFSLSGSSMVAAPFRDGQQRIVGVLGIIGPTRLNYARVVPMVDYTAQVISGLVRSPYGG